MEEPVVSVRTELVTQSKNRQGETFEKASGAKKSSQCGCEGQQRFLGVEC